MHEANQAHTTAPPPIDVAQLTAAVLPPIADIGRRLRFLADCYDRADQSLAEWDKSGQGGTAMPRAIEARMRNAERERNALASLTLAMSATSLTDAAVQAAMAFDEANRVTQSDLDHLVQTDGLAEPLCSIRTALSSILQAIVSATGIDIDAVTSAGMATLAATYGPTIGHAPARAQSDAGDQRMVALAQEYEALSAEFADVSLREDNLPTRSRKAAKLGRRAQEIIDREKKLLEEMCAARPQSRTGLRAKALMLLAFYNDDPRPEGALMASLANDILEGRGL